MANVEIERKFIVRVIPTDIHKYPSKEILQGYIALLPEVRVRQKGEKFFLTIKLAKVLGKSEDEIKSTKGLARDETEVELNKEQFDILWPTTLGKRIEKTRYNIQYKDKVVELDIYHGDHQGLVVAEVEFESVEDSVKFIPPSWFDQEVTRDECYKNKNLAK